MKKILFLITITLGLFVNAQNIDFKKKNFDNKDEFKIAKKALDDGINKYIKKNYDEAIPFFIEANTFNPNNADLNFKIGISYLKSDKKTKSLDYFKKAKQLDRKVHPLLEFGLAQAYQYNKQYKSALYGYNIFLAGLSTAEKSSYESKVNQKIKECNDAGGQNSIVEQPKELPIKEEKPIKKPKDEKPKDDTAKLEQAKPFDPNKKEEYKPVNAHPVNTETTVKLKEVKKEKAKPVKKEISKTEQKPTISKDNFIYKIQLVSSSRKLSKIEKKKIYKGSKTLQEEHYKGSYKYLIGNCNTREKALQLRAKINVQGAFLVKYKDGKRI